jgi:hypothetical protein
VIGHAKMRIPEHYRMRDDFGMYLSDCVSSQQDRLARIG